MTIIMLKRRLALGALLVLSFGAHDAAAQTSLDAESGLDASHAYTLSELVDLAETNSPASRVSRVRAAQRAGELGVAESEYLPSIVASVGVSQSRTIGPFLNELVPEGYVVTQVRRATPQLSASFLALDFGGRGGRIDAAKEATRAAAARTIRTAQVVAFDVAVAFYRLLTQEEAVTAAKQTLETARVTLTASEAQLANGRATAPDVLDARAAVAQANLDLQSALGAETVARIALTESVGVTPSPRVRIVHADGVALPRALSRSVDELLAAAMRARPDLAAALAAVRQEEAVGRTARSEYFPTVSLAASAGRTWEWPVDDGGLLGAGNAWTWLAALSVRWALLDGARSHRVDVARARQRELEAEVRRTRDLVVREVWTAHTRFLTALEKERAASALLEAATASFAASLEAYENGVRSIVDVVAGQRQLASARLANVSARSELLVEALDIELATGSSRRP